MLRILLLIEEAEESLALDGVNMKNFIQDLVVLIIILYFLF